MIRLENDYGLKIENATWKQMKDIVDQVTGVISMKILLVCGYIHKNDHNMDDMWFLSKAFCCCELVPYEDVFWVIITVQRSPHPSKSNCFQLQEKYGFYLPKLDENYKSINHPLCLTHPIKSTSQFLKLLPAFINLSQKTVMWPNMPSVFTWSVCYLKWTNEKRRYMM